MTKHKHDLFQSLDLALRLRHYTSLLDQVELNQEREEDERDAREFFAAEQCPADSNFR